MTDNKDTNFFDTNELDLDYEITEARESDSGGGFGTIPDGTHLAEIVKFQGWKSSTNDFRAAALTLKIIDTTIQGEEARAQIVGQLVGDKVFTHVKFRVVQLNDAALGVSHGGTKLVKAELLRKKVTIQTEIETFDKRDGSKGYSVKVKRYESPALFASMAGEVGDDAVVDLSSDV